MKQYGYIVYCDGAVILRTRNAGRAVDYCHNHSMGEFETCPCRYQRYVKKVSLAKFYEAAG
jgi:hypothetical protein